ncbi:MAG: hypothetical protein ACI4MI_04605 [Christensenellales bacterium]
MQKLIAIDNDLFDVAARIKSIDDNYQIYFNRGSGSYELHNLRCYPTKQADIPFARLDCRTVDWVRKTRVQNMEELIAEMNRHNEKIERNNRNEQLQRADLIIENTMRSLTRH